MEKGQERMNKSRDEYVQKIMKVVPLDVNFA